MTSLNGMRDEEIERVVKRLHGLSDEWHLTEFAVKTDHRGGTAYYESGLFRYSPEPFTPPTFEKTEEGTRVNEPIDLRDEIVCRGLVKTLLSADTNGDSE